MKKILFIIFVLVFLYLLQNFILHNHKKQSVTFYKNGAVVTAHPEATQVGLDVLKAGGNAFDAAIAVQFSLSVVYPVAGNIGGGGFMIARTEEGDVYALDFREKAPLRANRNMYLDSNSNVISGLSTFGILSVGVPGTVDGMVRLHEKLGSLPFDKLVEPSVNLAKNGFLITEKQAARLNYYRKHFLKINSENKYFMKDNWIEGDTLFQLDLSNTLELIKKNGRSGFYDGIVADKIVQTSKNLGGLLSYQDLNEYNSVWREPISGNYKGYVFHSMPPPSSGGVSLYQLLNSLEHFDLDNIDNNDFKYIHLLSEIEKRVYADRSEFLGDIDYYNVPLDNLLDSSYIKSRIKDIDFSSVTDSKDINPGVFNDSESEETTHFSIIDRWGNCASVTTTLNTSYGSKVFVEESGFLLNNEMDDFSIKPGYPNTYGLIGSEANSIEGGKRMLSSMTPTIIEYNGEPFLVIGTPGGSTIITSVFQNILNVIDFNLPIQQSVDNYRFHHQWKPDTIFVEKGLLNDTILRDLNSLGHTVLERSSIGQVNAIMILDNKITCGADRRGDNKALGY